MTDTIQSEEAPMEPCHCAGTEHAICGPERIPLATEGYMLKPTPRRPMPMTWDEPDGCTTPRGWLHLTDPTDHPDRAQPGAAYYLDRGERTCVGNYIAGYDQGVSAQSYLLRIGPGGCATYAAEHGWFHTIDAARAWIAGRAVDLLGGA